ncbi:acetyl-CoA carboxylase, biotin carboxyl carrier protein [Treponema medium ATCC 700293]|uniref:Biotin carboxyl carrier protein of acetyl-CoA carboxylase n=2 Tax=Treponema medium TaxID=58231 RepID=A0AA87NVS8_TREMD|nr:acetyl-CoA carboxylase biotin carboxyl carrier protein [Treponema medium]EPF29764.1 acetyl-CoA carboxylase, biotin carboxyl carrier protein [Treponema medium ATCC 700293]
MPVYVNRIRLDILHNAGDIVEDEPASTQSKNMNEKFILNVFDKFEKSSAVLLHIKEGEAELTLKKEAAYQNVQAAVPFAVQNTPMQPVAGVDTNGYAAAGTMSAGAAPHGAALMSPAVATGISTGAESNPTSANSVGAAANTISGTDANLVTVKSPIVGSFYRSPSPDAPAYVEKGAKVSKGQPLCILEAMKMMNTLECEYDGTIEEILAVNGDLVEFDQPLFIIRI